MERKNYWIPVGYVLILAAYFGLFMIAGCGGKVDAVIEPKEYDIARIIEADLKTFTTPEHNLKVQFVGGWIDTDDNWQVTQALKALDERFTELQELSYHSEYNEDEVKGYTHYLVDFTFACPYGDEAHQGRCNGRYWRDEKAIMLANKGLFREGRFPLAKHEWVNVLGIWNDHEPCTPELEKVIEYCEEVE